MADTPLVRREGGVNGGDSLTLDPGATLNMATGVTFANAAVNRKFVSEAVPSGTAGTVSGVTKRIIAPAEAVTIRAVTFQPGGACAGHATSNFTLSVRNLGVGATDAIDIATLALTTANALSTNVPKAFTVSTTGGAAVTALQSIVFYQTLASSGIDYPPGTITVEFSVDN